MKILYFDCFNGAAGDMLLGAFLDSGLPLAELRDAIGSLGIEEYEIAADRVLRAGVTATKFRLIERSAAAAGTRGPHVHAHGRDAHPHEHRPEPHPHHADESHEHVPVRPGHAHDHPHAHHAAATGPHGPHPGTHAHRSLREIRALIARSALSAAAKDRATELFSRLAEVEASIHGMPVDQVHLHEVGALDSIIDIVGAVYAFERTGADRIVVSPLNVGSGTVRTAHGVLPVPAPATLRLLASAPVFANGPAVELLTPTGALLLTAYASEFGALPAMRVMGTGYGAGDRDFEGTPNVVRLVTGEAAASPQTERLAVLACEIDDMNPQIFGLLMDRLYAAGALDVFYQPVQMKKNRPGTLVTVLAPPQRRDALAGLVFRETTTIGIRFHEVDRERLDREIVAVETPLGTVRFKVARRSGAVLNAAPEFDDCVRIAEERQLPLKDVQAAAARAWLDRQA